MRAHGSMVATAAALALVSACILDRTGGLEPETGNSGSSAGGAAGGSSQGAGPSSSAGPGVEDCLDGFDNDSDALADCDDPDCGAYACVPEVAGALAYLTIVTSGADCPADAPALAMSSCDCSCATTLGSCTVTMTSYSASGCPLSNVLNTLTSPVSCSDTTNANRWAIATTVPNGDGSCAPNALSVAPTSVSACHRVSAGACAAAAQVCVPEVVGTRCVALPASTLSCPTEYPNRQRAMYTGTVTQCGCACSMSPGCSTPSVSVSSSSNSCQNPINVAVATTCTSLGYAESVSLPTGTGATACNVLVTATGGAQQVVCCQDAP